MYCRLIHVIKIKHNFNPPPPSSFQAQNNPAGGRGRGGVIKFTILVCTRPWSSFLHVYIYFCVKIICLIHAQSRKKKKKYCIFTIRLILSDPSTRTPALGDMKLKMLADPSLFIIYLLQCMYYSRSGSTSR